MFQKFFRLLPCLAALLSGGAGLYASEPAVEAAPDSAVSFLLVDDILLAVCSLCPWEAELNLSACCKKTQKVYQEKIKNYSRFDTKWRYYRRAFRTTLYTATHEELSLDKLYSSYWTGYVFRFNSEWSAPSLLRWRQLAMLLGLVSTIGKEVAAYRVGTLASAPFLDSKFMDAILSSQKLARAKPVGAMDPKDDYFACGVFCASCGAWTGIAGAILACVGLTAAMPVGVTGAGCCCVCACGTVVCYSSFESHEKASQAKALAAAPALVKEVALKIWSTCGVNIEECADQERLKAIVGDLSLLTSDRVGNFLVGAFLLKDVVQDRLKSLQGPAPYQ